MSPCLTPSGMAEAPSKMDWWGVKCDSRAKTGEPVELEQGEKQNLKNKFRRGSCDFTAKPARAAVAPQPPGNASDEIVRQMNSSVFSPGFCCLPVRALPPHAQTCLNRNSSLLGVVITQAMLLLGGVGTGRPGRLTDLRALRVRFKLSNCECAQWDLCRQPQP